MPWIVTLMRDPGSAAHAVLVLGIVAAIGLAIGAIRVFGISLGVAGVLFAGLAFGHFGFRLDPHVMEFAREFGLILFVYTIGIQVGPGFVASLRKHGLPLNIMAAAIVLLGVAMTIGIHLVSRDRVPLPVAVGLFAGGTTNTPSLAAAQQALKDIPGISAETQRLPGLGYAVAYPFGIIGIIITMILMRWAFRVNLQKEAETFAKLQSKNGEKLATMNLEVRNPNLEGLMLSQVPMLGDSGVVVSRVMKNNQAQVARPDLMLAMGDVLLAVGPKPALEQLRLVIGRESKVDVRQVPSNLLSRRILVTKSAALGQTIRELNLINRFGATITRVNRADIELPVTSELRLQFGDYLVVVGDNNAIKQVSAELGDSVKRLNHPQIIPVFVGIALGVLLGSWPLHIPGMTGEVRLGLAGGPLIVAIILSRLGNIGPLVWHLPVSANFMVRELGIVLFLACVGLRSGEGFISTLTGGNGLYWMLGGALITIVPLMAVALFGMIVYKLNYLSLCGLLAGSMTDPPALAFAGSVTGSDVPSIAYATVYPLTMLLRVLSAQAIVLFLLH